MKTLAVISMVLVMAASTGAALGQIGASLTFEPPTQTVGLGGLADVGIRISGLGNFTEPSLSAFSLDIVYDPTVLFSSGVALGDPSLGDQLDPTGAGTIYTIDTSIPGLVSLYEVSFESAANLDSLQAPEFFLAALRFIGIGAGTSSLSFASDPFLFDSVGLPLAAAYDTGSVTVTSVPVPVPGAVLLGSLGLGSAGWLLRRKDTLKN